MISVCRLQRLASDDVALRTPQGADVVARTVNISRNGAYCRASAPIPLMTALHVRIELPGPGQSKVVECVECGGVVVRAQKRTSVPADEPHPYEIAIFFNRMSEASAAKLARFLHDAGPALGVDLPLED